jgi:hypothetical protein
MYRGLPKRRTCSAAGLRKHEQKELRELTARLRLVKPKRRKGYKQEITEHQRLAAQAAVQRI